MPARGIGRQGAIRRSDADSSLLPARTQPQSGVHTPPQLSLQTAVGPHSAFELHWGTPVGHAVLTTQAKTAPGLIWSQRQPGAQSVARQHP
jgi:hypothetical protein